MSITDGLPRCRLACLPTPMEPLPRLSASIGRTAGVNLWMKRDDQTGLAGGGNKTRKLEFLIGDALAQAADTILTAGGPQSNHCRLAAAAAAKAGLACELVLGGTPPGQFEGNLLLDELLGARLHWTESANRLARLAERTEELRATGRRPYPITIGGSDAVGSVGEVVALEELRMQCAQANLQPDALVFASSSGGTQAGLLAGAWALAWDVPMLGISIDEPEANLQAKVAELATQTIERLAAAGGTGSAHTFAPGDVHVNAGYLGGGYGVVGELEREAIALVARSEGIFLDPVYTARAFGALLDLLRRGAFEAGQNVLFWHTGGGPALFAYGAELSQ